MPSFSCATVAMRRIFAAWAISMSEGMAGSWRIAFRRVG